MRGALRCPVSQDAVDGKDDDPADEDDDGYGSAHGTVHPEQPSEQGDGYQHERLEPKLLEVLILEIAHRLGFLPVESHTHFISLIASPLGVPVMRSDLPLLQIPLLPTIRSLSSGGTTQR